MRRFRALGTCLFLLFLSTGSLSAQDVTGRWVFSVDLDVGAGSATFQLQQHGDSIAGTYSGLLGESIRISGKIHGDEIEFSFNSQAGKITYKGKVSGTTMEGTCDYGQLGPGTFRGSKAEVD